MREQLPPGGESLCRAGGPHPARRKADHRLRYKEYVGDLGQGRAVIEEVARGRFLGQPGASELRLGFGDPSSILAE